MGVGVMESKVDGACLEFTLSNFTCKKKKKKKRTMVVIHESFMVRTETFDSGNKM